MPLGARSCQQSARPGLILFGTDFFFFNFRLNSADTLFSAYPSIARIGEAVYCSLVSAFCFLCTNWIEFRLQCMLFQYCSENSVPYILCKKKKKKKSKFQRLVGPGLSRHNGHREPTHINTHLRPCRHGRSLSIRMRMCRWGLLPCKAKPWPFIFSFYISFVSVCLPKWKHTNWSYPWRKIVYRLI